VLVVQLPQNNPLEVFNKGGEPNCQTRVRLRRNDELVMDVTGNKDRNHFFLDGKIIPEEAPSTEAEKPKEATAHAWADVPNNP